MTRRNLATLDTDIGQMIGRPLQQAMAHGIENDMIYGGLIAGQTSVQNLYVSQTTQNCLVPSRRVTWQGEVYKYCRTPLAVGCTMFGLKFGYELGDGGGVAYTAPLAKVLAGNNTIRVDAGGAAAVTEDQLKGGYIIIHTHTDYHHMCMRITGNTLADGSGYTTITVEQAWPIDIETAYGVEIMPNPYMGMVSRPGPSSDNPVAGDHYTSVGGMPLVKSTAVNSFHWMKTWGPHWVNPLTPVGDTQTVDRRTVFFDYEGQLTQVSPAVTTSMMQIAGFIINSEVTAVGPPLIMLQITPV